VVHQTVITIFFRCREPCCVRRIAVPPRRWPYLTTEVFSFLSFTAQEPIKHEAVVYILPDNDAAGAAHARQVAGELNAIARTVRVLRLPGLPAKGDVTDWMEAGGDADQLVELLRTAEVFNPDDPAESEPLDQDNNEPQAAITLAYFNDMGDSASKRWIMKGVIARGETSSWIAPPGKGKSALLTDVAIHVASGTDWRGFLSKERCGVVYFALVQG
jgi:hypothetical protein